MRRYFADTWYFVARIDSTDAHHRQARRIEARVASSDITTHDAVLTEVLTYFSDFGVRTRLGAAAFVRESMRIMDVVSLDRPFFLRALDFYERRPDKAYSLVDCMSMVVMRDRGIEHVLTNDHHFRQEGFTVLSDAT